ncbi:hypothetical protein BH708_00760 [Brachybacterium sp. P6-10-X1]|uniref:DUF4097 family beta strand repeat-containing protein n=1 Tax=Brachybacterium sp. P6-10-X1 TaxID=1903186 RepID=UPI000971AD49|nr:DUF4097 family beta strand repeat-containing protein [Brachybacterium sp. P6-10-X1]APX31502.1 hypothetical protein BH708_00760 [Brachybacterium sp. P6-10-X1]
MTTTHPAPHRGTAEEPGRRLSPSPQRDRGWRTLITLLGAAVLLLALLTLAAASVTGWWLGRGYDDIPATLELGTPESLTLSSGVGDVQVLASSDVEEVTLALVEDGVTSLPAPDATARARITQHGGSTAPIVDVRQSDGYGPVPWQDEHQDVLVLIPLGHRLALDLTTDVGGIRADGDFSALVLTSSVGDVRLDEVSVTDSLRLRADVGDVEAVLSGASPTSAEVTAAVGNVEMRLPSDAGSDVRIDAELGEVEISLPGTGRWDVEARTELGETRIEPEVTGAPGPVVGALTVTSEMGDLYIGR